MTAREEIIQQAFDIAQQCAEVAAKAALPFYRTNLETTRKKDGSLVTLADKAAEDAILAVIRNAFPDHSILAEETGAHDGRADARWIVDPLDGTHRFARSLRFWGPLVAFELEGEIVAGAAGLPALGETYVAAQGLGAFGNGERLHVSQRTDWPTANISCGSLARILYSPYSQGTLELIGKTDYCMAGGDLEGGLLIAKGQAEVWIEFGVQPWDVAPMKIIIEEAGGRFTDLSGGCDLNSGGFLATNGLLHDQALIALNQSR